jgi:hypothetical protein
MRQFAPNLLTQNESATYIRQNAEHCTKVQKAHPVCRHHAPVQDAFHTYCVREVPAAIPLNANDSGSAPDVLRYVIAGRLALEE